MRVGLLLLPLAILPVAGCGAALPVLQGLAAAATVASDVGGIDVSIAQNQPGKTKIVQPATSTTGATQ